VNAYEVKAGMVFITGNTVCSMPEHCKVVCIPCKALCKCSALPLMAVTIAGTHRAYPRRDDQAELAWVVD